MSGTATQAREALVAANRVRMARAQIKRDITAGNITVPDVLENPDVATMTLGELLAAQHHWGPRRTARFLAAIGATVTKRVGTLTERQRDLIRVALREAA